MNHIINQLSFRLFGYYSHELRSIDGSELEDINLLS